MPTAPSTAITRRLRLDMPRTLGEGPFEARKVVDRTHPPVDESDEAESGMETPPADLSVDQPATTDAQ